MRRRGETEREIHEYIRARLRAECSRARGTAAEIARATGFTSAHIAQVQRPGAGIGESFARAMAEYWGLAYADLETHAKAWAKQHPGVAGRPPASRPYRPLSELPGWEEALANAQAHYRSIPDEIWERVARAVLPDITVVSTSDVGRTAQILYDHSPGQPGRDTDVTAASRKVLEANPPTSERAPKPGPRRDPPKRKASEG